MTRKENLLLLILAAVQFTHIVDFMILMPLGPSLQELFHISPQQFGWLVSSYSLSAGILGFLGATYTDRFDRKHVLLLTFAGFTLGTFACSQAQSYETLLLARILTGGLGGLVSSTVLSIVGDAIAPERRAQGMGVVTSAFSVASALGMPLALKVSDNWGWNAPFLLLAILGVGVLVLIMVTVPPVKYHLEHGHLRQSPLQMTRMVLADSNQLRALLFMTFIMLAQFSMIPYIPTHLTTNVGFDSHQLFWVYLVGGFVTIFTGPIIGKIADRKGRLPVYITFALISLIPVFLITNLGAVGVPLAVCVTTLFFIVSNGRSVPAFAMVTSVVTMRQRGSFMSINTAVQHMSLSLAAIIGGMMVHKTPDHHLVGYEWVGYMSMGFVLLSILMARTLVAVKEPVAPATKKTNGNQNPESGNF